MQAVTNIRNAVEEFKGRHKMASKAVSVGISSLPDPFGKVASILWDGIEKDRKGQVNVESVEKFLKTLEKIESQNEKSFDEIKEKFELLLKAATSHEDVKELGELIQTSNRPVIELIDSQFEKINRRLDELEKSFRESVNRLHLQAMNLHLVTASIPYSQGNRICWKKGKFSDEDIKSGYDWRRPITDDIIVSVQQHEATIIYGDPYVGKSLVAKRVMFEIVEQGYGVIYSPSAGVSDVDGIKSLLLDLSKMYPCILFISDDAHKKTGEASFVVFNKLQGITSGKLHFLFVAREKWLNKDANEVERALSKIRSQKGKSEFQIGFTESDAVQITGRAIEVYHQRDPVQEELGFGVRLFRYCRRNPFMFSLGLRHVLEGKRELADFVKEEIKENIFNKISDLERQESFRNRELWQSAVLSSLFGVINIPLNLESSGDLLLCANLRPEYIRKLYQNDILLDGSEDELRIRHQMFAYEFLSFLYEYKCSLNAEIFFHDYGSVVDCVWKSLKADSIVDMLYSCSHLYSDPRYREISRLITRKYVVPFEKYSVPPGMTESDKARFFLYGLAYFYYKSGDLKNSLGYYQQAMRIYKEVGDRNSMAIVHLNTAVMLMDMGRLEDALDNLNEALKIHKELGDRNGIGRDYAGIGNVHMMMGRLEDALDSHRESLKIFKELGNMVGTGQAYSNIGNVHMMMGRLEDALDNLNEALKIQEALNDSASIARELASIALVYSKLNMKNNAGEFLAKALNILYKLKEETGYHHPMIQKLEELEQQI